MTDMAAVVVELGLRFGLGASDDHGHQGEDQDFRRITAVARGAPADVRDAWRDHLLRRPQQKHALRVPRGELASAVRGARLVEHRSALRRGLAQMNRVDAIVFALMVNLMNLVRPREDALVAVAHHRVVLPAPLP